MSLRGYLIRNLLFPLASRRMGNRFAREYHELSASQWWSRDPLLDLERERLAGLLAHAFETVPFYHELSRELGLNPREIGDP